MDPISIPELPTIGADSPECPTPPKALSQELPCGKLHLSPLQAHAQAYILEHGLDHALRQKMVDLEILAGAQLSYTVIFNAF